ncbi:protein-tyrosine phosphatase family protein [Leptodesmis sichuanensis]|uniref:protein-tyrosine phosphatase family protein n=1 Tax=Leptodesmis sichuanensis TaxID=2906798 RepID=UPI001F1C3776|nr:dual specificity protein phosphatase family protein [Leptodesmis sichuanensis]UIE37428.1 dual specificity protein phosphatase family protein [Leptodesmis sichuanensis A121]
MEKQTIQPIVENLWWVIPGQLAGVRMPTAEELSELQQAGVGAIVSVFHDDSNLGLYEQAGLPFIWLPIAVDFYPTEAQLQEFLDFVDQQNELGHGVAVHCSTGRHRTGTILAAYLIRTGSSCECAMQTILAANPNINLPESQSNFLQSLAKGEDLT